MEGLLNSLSEDLLVKIWQHQLLGRTDLTTEEGEPIKIIYPGRINDDQGADLLDAAIATNQGLLKGDVEIHVKSSDWRAHRHYQDQSYNRVILHVVMWHDTKAISNLLNGGKVPTLALHKYIGTLTSQWTNLAYSTDTLDLPCHQTGENLPTGILAKFLDSAGKERFLAKAAKFQADLTQTEASQSLYQGIMGALGYSKNKLPFLELARRLPLQVLESLTQSKMSAEECLARQQALLLGTAGLLPSQRPSWHQKNRIDDRWVEKLEQLWASAHQTEVMSENNWHLFKVRPNNSPVRRLAAMSYLTLRYREKGIFDGLVNQLKKAAVSKERHKLEKALRITSNGYWASHFDFGFVSSLRNLTLLGSGRAADIAVNVLLPFTVAWGKFTAQPELARKALALYYHYPKLVTNTIERHMSKQLGLSRSLVNSARRQQGLIHIYNNLCSQGNCHGCPLGGTGLR
ncbi:MAG: DUF2851 family protein [Dehalococcoidales bacterium]